MSKGFTVLIEFLSAGVIASLVTGIFALIVSIKNNKDLIKIENIKQKFVLTQERYNEVKSAYTELLDKLPEDALLGHYIINLPLQTNLQKSNEQCMQEIAAKNYTIICSHYKKYEYLFFENDKSKILNLINIIDEATKKQFEKISNLDLYNIEIEDEKINDIISSKILNIVKLEDFYYDTLKHYLNMVLI